MAVGNFVDLIADGKKNLVIKLLPDGREWLTEQADEKGDQYLDSDDAFHEILERHLCNGWEMIRPEEIAALTDGTILSKDVGRDDDGKLTHLGAVYWHERYQVESPCRVLLDTGELHLLYRE